MKRFRDINHQINQAGLRMVGKCSITGGNHIKASCVNLSGIEQFFIFPSSPSDHRGHKQKLSELRRFSLITVKPSRTSP